MTGNDIYLSALAKIGECASEERTDDYAERAPYILASAVSDLAALDRSYRAMRDGEAAEPFSGVYLPLEDDFPLSDRFASVVSDYLASMLTATEDEALSDTLFDRFCRGVALITAEIPAERRKITDIYG